MTKHLSLNLIAEAGAVLDGQIRTTPLEYSPDLSERLKHPAYLKLECLQLTGSFKIRGALFALDQLSRESGLREVATCSAGNHGLAVAYAARRLGIEATVFVPKSVDPAKLSGMKALGANVRQSAFPGYDDTEAWARREAEKRDWFFLSAFDDVRIMAGNGGVLAAEIVQQLPEAHTFVFPVGGGGLAAGLSFYLAENISGGELVACQHEGSPGLRLSLERGTAVTQLPAIETVAGGIEGGIGKLTFEYLQGSIDRVVEVFEEEIRYATCWLLARHRYLVEPSGAVGVAATLSGKLPEVSGPTVFILTGRNLAFSTLRTLIESVMNCRGRPPA